jgi:hypothetical protein
MRSNQATTLDWTFDRAHEALIGEVQSRPLAGTDDAAFVWRGRRFQIGLREVPSGAVLTLRACLGAIPFSAQARESRPLLTQRLRAEPKESRRSFRIDAREQIWFESTVEIPTPCPLSRMLSVCGIILLTHDKLFNDILPFLSAPRPAAT